MKEIIAVILAAGYGKRMKSKLPKVMHKVCGKPVVGHVIDAAQGAGASRSILVISPEIEKFEDVLSDSVEYVVQSQRLGTAHAVMQTRETLADYAGDILVLLGDMPLLPASQLSDLIRVHRKEGCSATVLTAIMDDASGYGRIIRDVDGSVLRIVEHRDATPEERNIREINTGVFCFDGKALFSALDEVKPDNDQNEYYLTDVLAIMNGQGLKVKALVAEREEYGRGINSRLQLTEASEIMRGRILDRLMDEGVTIMDPKTAYIDATATIGRDTVIYPMTIIEGSTQIGEDCSIGPSTRLIDATVEDRVAIQNSVVIESSVGSGCNIGPFAYLRPETVLHENVKVGDFVELKKAEVKKGSKIPHLSYIGDSLIGEGVNIGAGTITCNYDGRKKHRTVIGDRAFVGSNTNLVAPVNVGHDVLIAAGSTVNKDIPPHSLAIARARQENKANWIRTKEQGETE